MDKQTILIVDDVELNRAILAELFSDIYHILEAENGREALDILEKDIDQVVMVLLDIVMPVMDGFEVLQEMTDRKLIEQVPVILITSENSDRAALQGYQLGVSDIINKPFNPKSSKDVSPTLSSCSCINPTWKSWLENRLKHWKNRRTNSIRSIISSLKH